MSKCQKCCTAFTVLFTASGLITVLILGTLIYPLEIRNALLKLTATSNISNSTNIVTENDTIQNNVEDSGVEHTTWYVPADPENSHETVKIHEGKCSLDLSFSWVFQVLPKTKTFLRSFGPKPPKLKNY